MNRVKNRPYTLLIALMLLLTGAHASAEKVYYRWTDDRGQQVHSDRPPAAGIAYQILSTGSNLVRPVGGTTGAVPAEISPRAGSDSATVNTKKTAIKTNPEYCARAQENLSRLETDARIRMRNSQGEARYLDEQERGIEKQKAISSIAAYCE